MEIPFFALGHEYIAFSNYLDFFLRFCFCSLDMYSQRCENYPIFQDYLELKISQSIITISSETQEMATYHIMAVLSVLKAIQGNLASHQL